MNPIHPDINTLLDLVPKYLMPMSEVDKIEKLTTSSTEELAQIFESALRMEDFEVCSAIKKVLSRREKELTQKLP